MQIKATCLPEMKKGRTYSLLLTIDKVTVDVTTARCTCPAGKRPFGSCKHIAALCFAPEDFVKLQEIIFGRNCLYFSASEVELTKKEKARFKES